MPTSKEFNRRYKAITKSIGAPYGLETTLDYIARSHAGRSKFNLQSCLVEMVRHLGAQKDALLKVLQSALKH